MIRTSILAAAVTAMAAVPLAAQTFRSENRVTVTPTGGTSFQISSGGGYGARGMWCAASDYAQDVLGAASADRIYVTGPRTSTSGPVTFDLNGNGAAPQIVVIVGSSLRNAGSNLSVAHAYQFCHDARLSNSR